MRPRSQAPDSGQSALDSAPILERSELLKRFTRPRAERLVFTNGVFDLLHRGHIESLKTARAHGDCLVVGLNSDASVRRLKEPGRPLQEEGDRAAILAALRCVDAVCIFDEDTPEDLIRSLSPDVLVKGADYGEDEIAGARHVRESGGQVVRVALEPGLSSTELLRRIREGA